MTPRLSYSMALLLTIPTGCKNDPTPCPELVCPEIPASVEQPPTDFNAGAAEPEQVFIHLQDGEYTGHIAGDPGPKAGFFIGIKATQGPRVRFYDLAEGSWSDVVSLKEGEMIWAMRAFPSALLIRYVDAERVNDRVVQVKRETGEMSEVPLSQEVSVDGMATDGERIWLGVWGSTRYSNAWHEIWEYENQADGLIKRTKTFGRTEFEYLQANTSSDSDTLVLDDGKLYWGAGYMAMSSIRVYEASSGKRLEDLTSSHCHTPEYLANTSVSVVLRCDSSESMILPVATFKGEEGTRLWGNFDSVAAAPQAIFAIATGQWYVPDEVRGVLLRSDPRGENRAVLDRGIEGKMAVSGDRIAILTRVDAGPVMLLYPQDAPAIATEN